MAWDVYVSGKYAYVADGGLGLRIIDISTPSNPIEVGYFEAPGEVCEVFISDDYAYIAIVNSGLYILQFIPIGIDSDGQ